MDAPDDQDPPSSPQSQDSPPPSNSHLPHDQHDADQHTPGDNPHDSSHASEPGSNAPPSSQTPGHPSFRRQRASRACQTCHQRKVRCDAASLGVPCTNCVAFNIECKIPAPKRKKSSKTKQASDGGDSSPAVDTVPSRNDVAAKVADDDLQARTDVYKSEAAVVGRHVATQLSNHQEAQQSGSYAQVMKPKFARAPIKDAGRVAYLGESSNLSLLVQDHLGTTDAVHYPLPENVRGQRAKTELDNNELDILHQRGAFLLPPRGLCDELVDAFFTWVAPVVPVINRARFMRRYNDSKNPPSLLLLQAMLLAGSRVCKNSQLMDSNGSTTPAAMTFYKRAKALFDANYEDDRVTIVQALILMGWYWEGPEDVTRNVFFWSRVAIIVAQGTGMHRSVENSQLSPADKRLWKRIWWTLFTRDRSVAVALGRPCCINVDDSDVEMLTEDDFNDDEPDKPSEYKPDPIHVQFFLSYVRLTEIMGLVLSQQYSVAYKVKRQNALDLTHSDMALADWLQNCPKEVYWEKHRHHFWSALLHANYYTTLCLLHRAHMPPAGTPATTVQNGVIVQESYPSRNIAYQAAAMITSIVECLKSHDQLRFTPAFVVYSLFSALIMHVYQMRSSNHAVVQATEQRLHTCLNALKEVSKVWLVAKMVHTLFDSILGNKQLEERLQKAPGKRHQRPPKQPKNQPNPQATAGINPEQMQRDQNDLNKKRKYDDVDMGFQTGPPSAKMSYERSRPQTPSKEAEAMRPPGQPSLSPNVTRHDAFMGNSANATRQTTPFNPQLVETPDLFLVTRNSPNLSQDLMENFQPTQLFPAESNNIVPDLSPVSQNYMDPHLGTPTSMNAQMMNHPQSPGTNVTPTQQQFMNSPNGGHLPGQFTHRSSSAGHHPGVPNQQGQQMQGVIPRSQSGDPNSWAQIRAMNQRQPSAGLNNEDAWSNSNSTMSQPNLPTTMNVEDWFNFFGMNGGDLNGMQRFG